MTALDEIRHRNSGKVCTKSQGCEMIWSGHLCEGANLTAPIGRDFCLWTRCGNHDVPADKAYRGDIKEVSCPDCLAIWSEENGQFGVGA